MSNREPAKLTVLVERHFIPDRCGNRSSRYVWSVRAAVRLWGDVLGRDATADDFTEENLASFVAHLRHAGFRAERLRELRKRLRALWAYAHRLGLATVPARVRVKVDDDGPSLELPSSDRPRSSGDEPFSVAHSPAPPGTVRHFYQTVYEPQQLADKAAVSVGGHIGALRSLWHHYRRDLDLAEQTDALAAEHFKWMKEQGKSNFPVNSVRACWFAQWRLAAERGLVPVYPMLRRYKVSHPAPDAWTIDEMRRILAAADDRWRAIILVGYWTLQRRRALLAIPVDNVDLDGRWIDFPPSSIKTAHGIRCRIGSDAVTAIRALQAPTGKYLFQLGYKELRLGFADVLARAKIPKSRRVNGHFHKLRRTGATHIAARGGLSIACDLLGHSSVYVSKFYIDRSQLLGHDVTLHLPLLVDDAHPLLEKD